MEHDSIGHHYEGGGGGALAWLRVKVSILLVLMTRLALASNNNVNQFYSVTELCQDSFMKQQTRMIEGAVVVSRGERDLKCVVTFQTDSILQRFMLRFERLQLDCNDHLFIYDGAYAMGNHKADLSCRNTLNNVGTLYTQTNHVTLRYVTDQWGPAENGFRLLITAFKDKKHTCMHFRCETTNVCVDKGLMCDDVNHCGDGSDESTSMARCPTMPLWEFLGVSGRVLVAIVAAVAVLCCSCGVIIVVCLYRRNRAMRQPHLQSHPQMSNYHYPAGPMVDAGGNFGTNGTFGTLMVEKPPPYPGAPQHTSVIPPDSSPGNLARPVLGVGCSTLPLLTALCCPFQ